MPFSRGWAIGLLGWGLVAASASPAASSVFGPYARGLASWYGGGERLNQLTASGEPFDPARLTCASWDFPFGTTLQVTNLKNDRSVLVRVNDRGPARRLHRLVDLSRAAFARLADLDTGLIPVEIAPHAALTVTLEGVYDSGSARKLVTPPAPTST